MSKAYENKKEFHFPKDAVSETDYYQIRQNSKYAPSGKSEPDNNIFREKRSNPLSSKGN